MRKQEYNDLIELANLLKPSKKSKKELRKERKKERLKQRNKDCTVNTLEKSLEKEWSVRQQNNNKKTSNNMQKTSCGKTVYFKALGLKSKIPLYKTYTDLGFIDDPYEAYQRALQQYGKETQVTWKEVAGIQFSIVSGGKQHHFITYKYTDHLYTKLTRIHEEVHALFYLRPEHLERYLHDVYHLNIKANTNFIKEHRKIYYPDLSREEKALYDKDEIDEELLPRIVENAYLDKKKILYEDDRPLFQEAKRLYHKFKEK